MQGEDDALSSMSSKSTKQLISKVKEKKIKNDGSAVPHAHYIFDFAKKSQCMNQQLDALDLQLTRSF